MVSDHPSELLQAGRNFIRKGNNSGPLAYGCQMVNPCLECMNCIAAGTISVKAILEEGKRSAEELIVNPKKRSRDIAYLIALAKQAGIPVRFAQAEEMRTLHPNNGGIIIKAQNRSIPLLTPDLPGQGLNVYVSGVEDPYNLGSIARTLYAAGASRMIVWQRDWSSAQDILLRASAGAWERLDIVAIDSEAELLDWAQKENLPLVCASRDDQAASLFETQLPDDVLLAIGGAMRGLSASMLEAPGQHVYIPYGRQVRNALDSVGATAVFAFTWTREHGSCQAERLIQNELQK